MFSRTLINTARAGSRVMTRKASTVPEHVGPIRAFFREVPMPPEAYPLAGLVVSMIGWATYHSAKHIREDRDHLRWYPGAGNFEYVEPELKELPMSL